MTKTIASDALAKTLHMGMPEHRMPCLFLKGSKDALSIAERKDLLERVRAGESLTIEVDAITYIQRDTPNRNAIRFPRKASTLRRIAKSGVGAPVLRDHDQNSVMSRGGKVLSSKAVKNDAGEWEFHQRLELVKPWAVEGVLDGTIDRFSIGWYPLGPITYSHNGEEVLGWPEYWPGDTLEDGTVVEWVYEDAQLIEVSCVNVPAVTGTHIEGIRTALSAAFEPRKPQPKETAMTMKKTIAALGLSEAVSDESAADAVQSLKDANAKQLAELTANKEALKQANGELESLRGKEQERELVALEADIEGLYKSGKLLRSNGADGQKPDAMEAQLRNLYSVGGREMFDNFAGTLHSRGPVVAPQAKSSNEAPVSLGLSADRKRRLRSLGMTEERYHELANKYEGQGRIKIPGRGAF